MTSSFIRQTADGRYEYGTVARAPGCRKDTMTVVGVRDTYEAAQIADYQMRKRFSSPPDPFTAGERHERARPSRCP